MPEAPRVRLLNRRGQMTDHVFSPLQEWSEELRDTFGCRVTNGWYPMFRCTETDAERVYGCVRRNPSTSALEALFGPLDADLRARNENTREAA